MNKLKILWKNRTTWTGNFNEWWDLMFPHLYYPDCPDFDYLNRDNAWWFWWTLNNYGNVFDEEVDTKVEYKVVCDETNNTPQDIENGIINADVCIIKHKPLIQIDFVLPPKKND